MYPRTSILIVQSDILNTLSDIRALTHLDVSGNNLGQLVSSDGWEAHSNGTHYRQHGGNWTTVVPAGLQPLGIITIANAIPDMGAICSINLLKNHIEVEQVQELVKIMQGKEKLVTLCGLSKEATELDFSKQDLRAGDAVLIANDISDMGALTTLDISENKLSRGALKAGKKRGRLDSDYETDMTGMTHCCWAFRF
jgi:Leucine-rich repeat (LRR) protein